MGEKKRHKISVIIPTLNEAEYIGSLVSFLRKNGNDVCEVIISDAQSKDATREIARNAGAKVLKSRGLGRAVQMNLAVRQAKGDIFYFVHADAKPPVSFSKDIISCLEMGDQIGGYRLELDSKHPVLKFLSWCSGFSWEISRGGDQTMFISRELFENLGGFDESYVVMEDFEIIRRACRLHSYRVLPKSVRVSARKYEENSVLRVCWANLRAVHMFKRGEKPQDIKNLYYKLLKHPKANDELDWKARINREPNSN